MHLSRSIHCLDSLSLEVYCAIASIHDYYLSMTEVYCCCFTASNNYIVSPGLSFGKCYPLIFEICQLRYTLTSLLTTDHFPIACSFGSCDQGIGAIHHVTTDGIDIHGFDSAGCSDGFHTTINLSSAGTCHTALKCRQRGIAVTAPIGQYNQHIDYYGYNVNHSLLTAWVANRWRRTISMPKF